MKKKRSERIYEKTPSGGDYSEIIYLDQNHEVVDPEKATWCVIRECKMNGELVHETFGTVEKKQTADH